MALDPNEELPGLTGIVDDPDLFPPSLPAGVEKTKDWYAHRRTYRDGRVVWEFFKRGSGGGPGGQGDAVAATTTLENKVVKEKWDKEREAETSPPTVSAPPTQPNIVSRNPDGSLATTPNPNYTPPAGATTKPAGSTTQIEGTPLPGGGFDNERPVMVTRGPDGKVISSEPLNAAEEKQWRESRERSRNPGGKTDAEIRAEGQDRVGKPTGNTRQRSNNGTTVKETEYLLPDGSKEWRAQTETAAPDLVGKPTGNTRQRTEGGQSIKEAEYVLPNGTKEWRTQTAPEAGAARKNIDPFVPDPGQPDLGVGAWAAAQRAKIGGNPESGGITQADYDAATKEALGAATVYITNVTSGNTVRRTAEQDERDQRETLSNQSASDYGRAQTVFNDIWQYTKPGSRAIMDVIPGIMAEQAKYRKEREATARPAPPLHPMFAWTGQNPGTPPPAPAAVPPTPPPALGPPPAALATPPAAPVQPSPAAAPAMAAPVPAPPPVAGAPAPAAPVQPMISPAVVKATTNTTNGLIDNLIRPDASGELGQPTDPQWQLPPNEITKAMPAAGPVSAWAHQALGPQAPPAPPAAPGQPVLPDLQAGVAAQPPAYDPFPVAGRMAQWGLPAEAIAQAMRELGMLPDAQGAA